MSSLQDLPLHLQESIAGLVAASSPQAMEDLRSLRATCKQMHRACTSAHVGWCLPLRRMLWRAYEANDADVHDFGLFRDTLLANLTRDVVGNPDACYLSVLREVFVDNYIVLRPSLHLLERGAEACHQLAAYMLGLCLYRRNSGTNDDDHTFRLICKVEGNENTGAAMVATSGQRRPPMGWNSWEYVRPGYTIHTDLQALLPAAELVIREGLDGYPVPLARPMVHGEDLQWGCPHNYYYSFPHSVDMWEYCPFFCNEKCRIRRECNSVFDSYFW